MDGTVAAYRLPYLLAGDSVVLKQDSGYYEHFYNELRPWEHYIPVRADLADLLGKIQWARDHDEEVGGGDCGRCVWSKVLFGGFVNGDKMVVNGPLRCCVSGQKNRAGRSAVCPESSDGGQNILLLLQTFQGKVSIGVNHL